MKHLELSPLTFIDPYGSNRAAIEELTHRVARLLVDTLGSAAQRSPLPLAETSPLLEDITLPQEPRSEDELLEQIHTLLTQSMNAAHPGYMGHMDTLPATFSVLGELITAALNNNMLSVEMSPLFSRLETRLLRQIAHFFGLGEASGGLLVSGGTLANLHALTVARNAAFPVHGSGIVGLPGQPVILASQDAHTSLHKAAMLLGLGTEAVLPVATTAAGQMDIAHLQQRIAQARQAGQIPFCVVATAGTTVTGIIDPLPDVGALARAEGLWFHVDASYGGALMFSPRQRARLAGIEQADSVTFNPQKWLYVTKTSAMILFRNMQVLHDVFQINAPYMWDMEEQVNLGEISIQGTRHAEVVKLWLTMQHIGLRGYAQIIDASYHLAAHMVQHIRQRPFLALANAPAMNIVCFRAFAPTLSLAARDEWNSRLQRYLLQHGHVFLSLPHYRQQRWLKAVLLNPYTSTETLDALFAHIDSFAANEGG
jgi:glutamate/tyrosine decarboxylase-like PLP-dependent enzyme